MFRNTSKFASMLLASLILVSLVAVVPASAQTGGMNFVAPTLNVANIGDTFTVQINVNVDHPISSAVFRLNWDSSKMSCSAFDDAANVFRTHYAVVIPIVTPVFTTLGRTSYGMGGQGNPTSPITGTGKLVTFTCTALANGDTALALDQLQMSDPDGYQYGPSNPPTPAAVNGSVHIGPATGPDLVPQNVLASIVAGQANQFNLSYSIANIGNQPAVSSLARVTVNGTALTPDATITTLTPGNSQLVTQSAVPFTGATAHICVTADATNVVAETNENNNTVCTDFSSVSDTKTTTIECGVQRYLQLTAPANISGCNMQVGLNTCTNPMNVKANAAWEVSVKDADTAHTNGHLTDWNGSAYLTTKLFYPLHILAQANNVTLPGPGVLAAGAVSGQNDNLGQDVPVTFSQEVVIADPVLPSGHVYRIVATFTAYLTF